MATFEEWLTAHTALAMFIVQLVGALVTLSAVLVAWRTAASTKRTVAEMREARLQAVRPVLYASATQRNFEICFEPDKSLNPSLVFPSPEGVAAKAPFEIRNAVDAPAFDVECEWELGREADLPADFRLASLKQAADKRSLPLSYENGTIKIDDDGDFGLYDSWNYSKKSTTNHLEILGGNSKSVNIPQELKYQIACLALTRAEKQQIYNEWAPSVDIPLSLAIACSAPSGERIVKRFYFKVTLGFAHYVGTDGKISARGQLPHDWKSIKVMCYIDTKISRPIVLVNPTVGDLFAAAARTLVKNVRRMAPLL